MSRRLFGTIHASRNDHRNMPALDKAMESVQKGHVNWLRDTASGYRTKALDHAQAFETFRDDLKRDFVKVNELREAAGMKESAAVGRQSEALDSGAMKEASAKAREIIKKNGFSRDDDER